MTEQELAEITALDKGLRFNDPGYYLDKPIRIFDQNALSLPASAVKDMGQYAME